jgi:sarcosine oxidase
VRVLIVGGGVIGLLTAVEAVSAGHDVVLCDGGTIPNPRATSFDRHRVLRALHPDDPVAAEAATRAHRAWMTLAGPAGWLAAGCYQRVGAMSVVRRAEVAAAVASLPGARVEAVPNVVLPPETEGVFEANAGVLLADRVLVAAAAWLGAHPRAELRERHHAVAVDAGRVTVSFADPAPRLGADAVLLAGGPWSRDLLPASLRPSLHLYRQSMLYCEPPEPVEAPAWPYMPSIRGLGPDGAAWLVPPVAGTPLKLSAATACRRVTAVTDHETPPRWREHLLDVWSSIIPNFRPDRVSAARDCYYLARAADAGAAVVELGDAVWSFAACGGGAFKFAPLVARALVAQLGGAEPFATGATVALPYSTLRGVS